VEDAPVLQRSLWTWQPAEGNAPGLWVVADRFEGTTRDQEKRLQIVPGTRLRDAEWNHKRNAVDFRHGKGAVLRWRVFAPRELAVDRISHNKEFTRGLFRVALDREKPDARRLDIRDPGSMLSGDLERLTLDFERDLEKEKKAAAPETVTLISVFTLGDGRGEHPEAVWTPPILTLGPHRLRLTEQGWEDVTH
jgi:hypothetical protein